MKVYISGPMTGVFELNYPAFFEAESILSALGYEVINPAKNNPDGPKTWENYMKMSIKQVCDSDIVTTLEDWDKSTGANIEVDIANKIKTPVVPFHTLKTMQPWRRQ